MLIKIKNRNQERFNDTVTRVMNLVCIAIRKGSIPTSLEMKNPETKGMFWYENIWENKFELLPILNNHKAFIRSRGENFMVVEFYYRYDRDFKLANALANLVLSFFDNDEVEAV